MGQLIRIREMEQRLTSSLEAVRQLEEALDRYQAAQADITILATYLNSDEWIWNLLDDNSRLARQMQTLADQLLQTRQ